MQTVSRVEASLRVLAKGEFFLYIVDTFPRIVSVQFYGLEVVFLGGVYSAAVNVMVIGLQKAVIEFANGTKVVRWAGLIETNAAISISPCTEHICGVDSVRVHTVEQGARAWQNGPRTHQSRET